MQINAAFPLLKETFNRWSGHQAPRLGASVAFYTLLSLAPLLILTAAVIALVFSKETAHQDLVAQARQMMGTRGADIVNSLLANAQQPSSGIFASIVAFLILLFGASGVFIELRGALNTIWEVKAQTNAGWKGMLKDRLFSFGMHGAVHRLLTARFSLAECRASVHRQIFRTTHSNPARPPGSS
ncbi:MAG: YhjD/YihY/BrkB family envelope integrity protein [Bryobacteraceae bacterium]